MTLEKERKLTIFKNLIVNFIACLSGLVDYVKSIYSPLRQAIFIAKI